MMVGHNTRRRLVFRRARKILGEHRLGTIVAIEMNVSRPAGLFVDLPAWKADPKITPLLPMTQLGIHFIDTLHYLFETKTVRVGCIAKNIAMKGGALDATTSILELETGIPATLSCYYSTPDVYYIRVYGTDGILDCRNSSLKLELLRNGVLQTELEEDFSSEGYASFEEEMREFGSCIADGAEPETGGEEGLQALAVIEAMVRSLNSNAIVNIKDILKGE
jgi:predicted dehydrogenase